MRGGCNTASGSEKSSINYFFDGEKAEKASSLSGELEELTPDKLANWAISLRKAKLKYPKAPWRIIATMSSAVPGSSYGSKNSRLRRNITRSESCSMLL